MIEIIREEDFESTDRKELPKDIKQIGNPDIGDRIYVENQVYEFLHPYDDENEKSAYILLGRFENYAGRQCTFVEAAIKLSEIAFDGELPVWNDQTWAYIYRQLKREHDSMAIVGWAMDIRGRLPNLTARLEALHENNFGGAHQILFLMDGLEREEVFYGSRNGHLYRREGFYIYYDKSIPVRMNRAMENIRREEVRDRLPEEEHHEENVVHNRATLHQGSYRRQMLEQEEKQQMPSYATSFLLLVVVCAFGITAYANYQKMDAMQETLARMNGTQIRETQMVSTEEMNTQSEADAMQENIGEENVKVESVAGNVEKQIENPSEDSNVAETPVTEIPTTETSATVSSETPAAQETQPENVEVLTEAQTYLAQGYYVVQKGDSLVGICKKIYQTTAMMDKLCEVNEIENEDEIFAGQRLILPN